MNKIIKYIVPGAALLLFMGLSSCVNDLHVTPIDPSVQTEVEPEQLFNKCYANFAVAGNGGANGDSDVDGIDGGTSGLYRQYWNSQELPTDESICGWGDEGIPSYCYNTYDASHPMLAGYYYRLCVGISYCNQYLTNFGDYDQTMTAEVRFLRAFSFYLLMDAFGNIPFTTVISSDKPQQYSRAQVYEFLEGELLSIVGEGEDNSAVLADAAPHRNGDERYGRVDKAAGWLVLSRLYLNAEVYTGTAQWSKAQEYAMKVVNSAYKLNTTGSSNEVTLTEPGTDNTSTEVWEFTPYQMLFMGDNDRTSAADEAIFPLLSDGQRTTSWGVSLFLIAATHDGDMRDLRYDSFYLDDSKRAINGVSGQAWGGNRARPELVRLFFPYDDAPEGNYAYDTYLAAGDDRALFDTNGRKLDVEDPGTFKNGYAVAKFNNLTTDNSAVSDATFPDMDVFMLRKAEAYLIVAECAARQGDMSTATQYVNILRDRANTTSLTVTSIYDVLDEWGREFYFEGHRRTDLIRYGRYGGNTGYNWQWKGCEYTGRNFDEYRNLFAIPTNDLTANNNLVQNEGYN